MDNAQGLREQVRDWFATGTDRRNGESKVNEFCLKVGISRQHYHRKINDAGDELDYDFLRQAADFMVEWKERKKKEQAAKRAQFEERAAFALAI